MNIPRLSARREQLAQQIAGAPRRSHDRLRKEGELRALLHWELEEYEPPAPRSNGPFYAWLTLLVVSVATSAAIVAAMLWR